MLHAFLSWVLLYYGVFFKKTQGSFQFVCKLFWLSNSNLNFILGIDGISLFFLFLTTLLIPLCLMVSWNSVGNNLKEFLVAFFNLRFFFNWNFLCFRLIIILYFFLKVF
jgi:NADH:ubiquinone oxidoreductase subunit 4 (subunit M)